MRMSVGNLASAAVLVLVLLAPSAARAQDTTRRAPARDSALAARKTAALEPVRVSAERRRSYAAGGTSTATKTTTLLRDVPQSVTVVTHELMRDHAMQGMADVVRYVPGITMGQGEGNRDQPTIRGNASTADFFVDGVRDDVQYYRDLYNVDRVEALKGANAMVFGRGGGGGVLNRVTKEARWTPLRELTLQGGSFDNKRVAADVSGGLASSLAGRLNGVYEHSGVFRDGVRMQRYGANPTVTIAPRGRSTIATVGYELFADHRTADRGVPSFQGQPLGTDVRTFFGDPGASYSDVRVHSAMATLTHQRASGVTVRNRTRYAYYDKIYQNVFPGAVSDAGDAVSISAYSNATARHNLFNQTDLTYEVRTGAVSHTLLAGAEIGRQGTANFRRTGYFNDTAATVTAAVARPTISMPLRFRQSATDADNDVRATTRSLYVQDQVALSSHWQAIAGVRYEVFTVAYHDNRSGTDRRRDDRMIAPRAGLVFKPVAPLSFYATHSVSYLPSAGDQFSSLTDVTAGLAPERFGNSELGAKWDVADRLALTAAAYRLERTNTRAPDPANPARTVQTGRQRTTGLELGANGSLTSAWSIAGGFTSQRAIITSTTSAARAGARVALVPRLSAALWNRYRVAKPLAVAIGMVRRSDMFAAADNSVTLPGYTEVDGALFLTLSGTVRAQMNVENLFDTRYFATSNGNNNIAPGSPRAVRVVVTTQF